MAGGGKRESKKQGWRELLRGPACPTVRLAGLEACGQDRGRAHLAVTQEGACSKVQHKVQRAREVRNLAQVLQMRKREAARPGEDNGKRQES